MKKLISIALFLLVGFAYGQGFKSLKVKEVNELTPVGVSTRVMVWDSTNQGQVKYVKVDSLLALGGANGLQNIVEDTTPELGGDLDVNGNSVTSLSNLDFFLDTNGDGTNQINRAFRIYNQNTSAENHLMQVYKSSINTVARAFTSFGNDGDLATYLTLYGDGLDTGAQIQLSNSNNEDDVVGAWVFTANANLEFGTQTTTALSIDDSTLALTVPSTTNADITSLGNKALITKEYADANYSGGGSSDGNDFVTSGNVVGQDLTLTIPNQTNPVIDMSSFALDSDLTDFVDKSSIETIGGIKTFTGPTDFEAGIVVEGTTVMRKSGGANQTVLDIVNPTQNNNINFQNGSGTVAFLSDITTADNLGNHTATQDLDLGGFNIDNADHGFFQGISIGTGVDLSGSGVGLYNSIGDMYNITSTKDVRFLFGEGTGAGEYAGFYWQRTNNRFHIGHAASSLNLSDIVISPNGNVAIGKGSVDAIEALEVGGKVKADGFDANSNKITNLSDGTTANDAVNKSQLDAVAASIPSNEITNVIVSDTTYTFVEADILASKQHYFTAPVTTDTIVLSIPEITHTSGNSIFILARATNDVPIKILDSINSLQYVNKTINEVVSLSSYQDDVWITHSNLNASTYTPPVGFNSGLILNGTFDGGNTTNVTLGTEWSVAGDAVRFADAGVASDLDFSLSTAAVNGEPFTLRMDMVSDGTEGRFRVRGGTSGSQLVSFTTYNEGEIIIEPLVIDTGNETSIIIEGSSTSPSAYTLDNVALLPYAPGNLILNGTFDDATNLDFTGTSWSVAGGVASYNDAATERLRFDLKNPLTLGNHTLTFTISNSPGGANFRVQLENTAGDTGEEPVGYTTYANGTHSVTVNVTRNDGGGMQRLYFDTPSSLSDVFDLDDVSLTLD